MASIRKLRLVLMLIIHSSRVAISYMAFPNLTMRTACLMVPHVGQERSLGDYNSIIDQRAPLNKILPFPLLLFNLFSGAAIYIA